MWTGCSLDSRFAVKIRIFHFPHNSYSVCWLPQLFVVTLQQERAIWGRNQCAISRVLSWAEVRRDWYTHNTSLLLTYLLCKIFMAHWLTPQGCHMIVSINSDTLQTQQNLHYTAVTSHTATIFIFQHITWKSSLLLLLSGTFLSATSILKWGQ